MDNQEAAEQWLEKAVEDLNGADVLLGAGIYTLSCYHAQQAGEKALKGYLSQYIDDTPKTHNVGELCKQCMDYDDTFSEILRISSALTPFATHTRYPGTPAYTREDAEDAIQKAGRIFIFSQDHIELLEQGFDEEPEQSGPTMRMQ